MPDTSSFLKNWTHQFNIQKTALNELLKHLKQNGHPNLPADSRTLLRTPTQRTVVTIPPGQYSHIGVFKALDNYLSSCPIAPSNVEIDFNIDGVPISHSTPSCFWLILAQIWGENYPRKVFVIGVYHGNAKPDSFQDFLQPFISEVGDLNNYKFNGVSVKAIVRCIICDAPARNSCLGNKAHSGYFGCGKCTQKGERRSHRLTFPEMNAEKRTNDSFRNKEQPEHHVSDSPFLSLDIDMVVQFPLEYLHTVCLGVVKKTIGMWSKAVDGDLRGKLPPRDLQVISDNITSVSQTQPVEFQRKCRPLKEFANFKATEFRSLILYILPIVTKDILPDDKYQNILILHAALIILIDPVLAKTHAQVAHKMLQSFVRTYAEIYGRRHVIYNVHSLLHMVDDVMVFGSLDNYSAFPFESYMFRVKRMLKKKMTLWHKRAIA